ncbi:hypothetical protein DEO72_LG5g2288 [Vigna unguiculata]|uniref:Uncharacterized protein n=1 Tax=Vigna unguiculata TaxID=3917 RepID=A0A4D6LZY8_VIGUN|nr:hypothetical protein DEO72_LG5g2288 [Vigna unguiculata]
MARKQWGSGTGGTWQKGASRQAMATKSIVSWSTSTWQYELSRRVVVNEFAILRRLAPGGTCPPLGDLVVVSPGY